jgi:hypothetical protein
MKVTKMTEQDLQQMRQLFREEVPPLRTEFSERLEAVHAEFTERIENHVNAIQFQTAGMRRSLTEGERLDSAMVVTQAAQQRAIDPLAARVARIGRELHFEGKQ